MWKNKTTWVLQVTKHHLHTERSCRLWTEADQCPTEGETQLLPRPPAALWAHEHAAVGGSCQSSFAGQLTSSLAHFLPCQPPQLKLGACQPALALAPQRPQAKWMPRVLLICLLRVHAQLAACCKGPRRLWCGWDWPLSLPAFISPRRWVCRPPPSFEAGMLSRTRTT